MYTEFKVEEMKDYMYTAEATIRDELSVCVCDRQGDRERESGGSENKLLLETTLDIHIQTKNTHKKAIHHKQPQTHIPNPYLYTHC